MKENKLRAYWSKRENDIMIVYPLGIGTKCDGHYLSGLLDKEFTWEMEDRGYDITSMRFEITVDKRNKEYKKRFPTLAAREEGDKP